MRWRSFAIRVPPIPCLLFGTCALAKKKPPAKPVNTNTSTSEELQQVPGIGPATADKILQMRKSYGAFKNVDDLPAIRGIVRWHLLLRAPVQFWRRGSHAKSRARKMQEPPTSEPKEVPRSILLRASREGHSFPRGFGVRDEAGRCEEGPGRRYGCRSLPERQLFSGGW